MRKIAAKFREIIKMKAQPVLDLLKATKELNDADSGAGGPELKEFGKLLNDESTRKALFQSVDIDQADGLLAMLYAQDSATMDRFTAELAKTLAADSGFMDPLCKKAIEKEAAKATDKGTFFRENSLATKLASTYVTNSPAGKAYCENVSGKFLKRSKGKGPLEVDPVKNTNLSDKDIQKNITAQKKFLGPVIDDLTSDPNAIPPEMAKIAGIFFDEAKRVTGDDDFATTQAGGFIMLRVVNPVIIRTSAERTNAQKKDSDRDKAANDQRLATLQTKLLQNMSNGATSRRRPSCNRSTIRSSIPRAATPRKPPSCVASSRVSRRTRRGDDEGFVNRCSPFRRGSGRQKSAVRTRCGLPPEIKTSAASGLEL